MDPTENTPGDAKGNGTEFFLRKAFLVRLAALIFRWPFLSWGDIFFATIGWVGPEAPHVSAAKTQWRRP